MFKLSRYLIVFVHLTTRRPLPHRHFIWRLRKVWCCAHWWPSQSELWRGVKEIDPHQSCQKKKKVKNRHKTFYIFSAKSDNAPAKSLLLRSKTFILHGMINTAASRGPWSALTLKLSQEKKHSLASFSSVYSHIIFFCTISLDITELRLFISLHLPSNKNSNLTVHNQISLFFFLFCWLVLWSFLCGFQHFLTGALSCAICFS